MHDEIFKEIALGLKIAYTEKYFLFIKLTDEGKFFELILMTENSGSVLHFELRQNIFM
jgi:hypothetical protein